MLFNFYLTMFLIAISVILFNSVFSSNISLSFIIFKMHYCNLTNIPSASYAIYIENSVPNS